MTALRLEAQCVRHGVSLPWCDACANIHVMQAWAAGLSPDELAEALETIADDSRRYYTIPERQAILVTAARRVRRTS